MACGPCVRRAMVSCIKLYTEAECSQYQYIISELNTSAFQELSGRASGEKTPQGKLTEAFGFSKVLCLGKEVVSTAVCDGESRNVGFCCWASTCPNLWSLLAPLSFLLLDAYTPFLSWLLWQDRKTPVCQPYLWRTAQLCHLQRDDVNVYTCEYDQCALVDID